MIEKIISDNPHFQKTDYTWRTLKAKIANEDYVIENGIKYVNL